MRRLALLVLVVGAGACRAKPDAGPSCVAIAGQFFNLATQDLRAAHPDPTTERMVLDQLPALRDSLEHACTDGAWSKDVRTCMGSASDHAAFQACEAQLTDAQKSALRDAAAGKTKSP